MSNFENVLRSWCEAKEKKMLNWTKLIRQAGSLGMLKFLEIVLQAAVDKKQEGRVFAVEANRLTPQQKGEFVEKFLGKWRMVLQPKFHWILVHKVWMHRTTVFAVPVVPGY